MKKINRDKNLNSTPTVQAFIVKLGNKVIDTIFYSKSCNVDIWEIKKSLVEHGGYSPDITVYKRSY